MLLVHLPNQYQICTRLFISNLRFLLQDVFILPPAYFNYSVSSLLQFPLSSHPLHFRFNLVRFFFHFPPVLPTLQGPSRPANWRAFRHAAALASKADVIR
ncbi:hypothetical protein V6Z12_D13G123500 [Gossypium hirsutum]